MSRAYWRSPGTYADVQSLVGPGFAYEYLKRNPGFLEDQKRLVAAARNDTLDPTEADAFAQHWGLRFRNNS